MKICFDANVVIDIFLASDDLLHSFAAYDIAALCKHDTYVCASSVPTIAYVLHRRGMTNDRLSSLIPAFFELFSVLDTTESDCKKAASNPMGDYEDAVIAESANRNGIDLILTRNVKDFEESPVPALTPTDFVRIYKPSNYEYDTGALS